MEGSDASAATRLVRGKASSSDGRLGTRPGAGMRLVLESLGVANAVAFLGASIIHFGFGIPLGLATLSDVTILPAGIAEGAIGVAFAAATAAVLARWKWAWNGTMGAYLLGIVGVLIGLSVSATDPGDSSRANFLFHLTVLPELVVGLVLLLTRSARDGLGRVKA